MRTIRLQLLAAILPVARVWAQPHGQAGHSASAPRDSVSAMATGLLTHVAPALSGVSRSEALVTQPMLMMRGVRFGGALQYAAMLNAERWTMPNGEPVAGIWGEGFIDRRHPHTVVHEVMLSATRRVRDGAVSLSAGRGTVPFGTDDPMVRPFTKYPANHHFAQVLERVQLVGAVRITPRVAVEVSTFNGDEPAGPTAAPRWSRFGDSHAARLTVWPNTQVEVQGSAASLRSPEFASGEGLDQRKLSASARWTPSSLPLGYLLVEWARTEERYRSRSIIAYGTGLVEALAAHGRWSMSVRAEQTSRPEEERLLDQFRTARPPTDLTILGITRWQLLTGQLAAALGSGSRWHSTLFAEATRARSTPLLRPVLLDPADVIGGRTAWHLTAGCRLGLGAMPHRVGRYGAAVGGVGTAPHLTMNHP